MILDLIFAVGGLGLLLLGSENMVTSSARLAERRGISPIVVGGLILGFGTSLPELVVSGTAAIRGDTALGVGNIVGSNLANLGLVLGFTALLTPIAVDSSTWRRVPVSSLSVALFALFMKTGGRLERWEGAVLLVAFVAATWVFLRETDARPASEAALGKPLTAWEVWKIPLGLSATLGGAQLAVEGFQDIAERLGWDSGFVGVSLVAVGTSLPELFIGLAGIRQKQPMLSLGNILGSNVFNSLAVIGLVTLVRPGGYSSEGVPWVAGFSMLGMVALSVVLFANGRCLRRWEGALLLAGYATALPLVQIY